MKHYKYTNSDFSKHLPSKIDSLTRYIENEINMDGYMMEDDDDIVVTVTYLDGITGRDIVAVVEGNYAGGVKVLELPNNIKMEELIYHRYLLEDSKNVIDVRFGNTFMEDLKKALITKIRRNYYIPNLEIDKAKIENIFPEKIGTYSRMDTYDLITSKLEIDDCITGKKEDVKVQDVVVYLGTKEGRINRQDSYIVYLKFDYESGMKLVLEETVHDNDEESTSTGADWGDFGLNAKFKANTKEYLLGEGSLEKVRAELESIIMERV